MMVFDHENNSKSLRDDTLLLVLQVAALFLIVAGVRFSLVWQYGSDLPFFDQWVTEGQGLIKKYFDGTLQFVDWFAPSNDHRLFFTRLEALALTLLNMQWDSRLEMVVNALFYSGFSAFLFYCTAGPFGIVQRTVWFIAVAALFTFPFGWENTVTGFQSQFYFLVVISFVAIILLADSKYCTISWFTGGIALFSALFTMSSGMLASYAMLASLGIVMLRGRGNWSAVLVRELPAVLLCACVALAGLKLMVVLEGLELYKAHSVFSFAGTLAACMAWPNFGYRMFGIVCWLPFAVFLVVYIMGRINDGKTERATLAIGIWVFLQLVGVAYARVATFNTSRYYDVLCLGLLLNTYCLIFLMQTARAVTRYRLVGALMLVWLAVQGTGLYRISFNDNVETRGFMYEVEAANTGAYLATGDYSFLVPTMSTKDIPYFDSAGYARLLNDPVIRRLLPGSVRTPLSLEPVVGALRLDHNRLGIMEATLHPGQRVWSAPVTAQKMPFEVVARKSADLPYVVFYLIGRLQDVVIKDAAHYVHPLRPLPLRGIGGRARVWQPVYAYCPGPECRISGVSAGAASVAFSEPRETGRWSIWALNAAGAGKKLFWTGIGLSVVTLIWGGMSQYAAIRTSARRRFSSQDNE